MRLPRLSSKILLMRLAIEAGDCVLAIENYCQKCKDRSGMELGIVLGLQSLKDEPCATLTIRDLRGCILRHHKRANRSRSHV